jgi:pantetheine-phosphate adenylyltransferase
MIKAVFPGSFDPPTFGHLNIIERACGLFDELLVVVAVNRQKTGLFAPEERRDLLLELLGGYPNVSVQLCDTLIVEFAKSHGCKVLVRGVRSVPDFSYEFELSIMNKGLNPGVETIFMPTDPRNSSCSARARSRNWPFTTETCRPWCRRMSPRRSGPRWAAQRADRRRADFGLDNFRTFV